MRTLPRSTWTKMGLAAGLGAFALATPAMAVPVTFNPGASSPALTTTGTSQFTADNATVANFSAINVTSTGAFTEQGILPVTAFSLNNSQIFPNGFGGNGGATPNYGLYLAFTGAGQFTSQAAGSQGVFTSVNFALYGDLNRDDGGITVNTLSSGGVAFTGNTGNDVLLGTGTLINGTGALNANNTGVGPAILPSANVLTNFTPAAGQGGFFVAPVPFAINFNSAFTNTGSVVTNSTGAGGSLDILIGATGSGGGGGNVTFLPAGTNVPEPASLALLGAGLLGLGMVRRRRAG